MSIGSRLDEAQTFKFNDELFLDQEDAKRAKDAYPTIWFALDPGRIKNSFSEHDIEALKIKGNFQRYGIGTVILALIALTLATIEPSLLSPLSKADIISKGVIATVAVLAGAFGIASFVMGRGYMGIRQRKLEWLELRMITERIRQWRWQYFASTASEIVRAAGDEHLEELYNEKRMTAFDAFVKNLSANRDQALADEIAPHSTKATCIQQMEDYIISAFEKIDENEVGSNQATAELLAAYDNIRFGGQVAYADHQVSGKGKLTKHPGTQLRWMHKQSERLIISILALHVLVVLLAGLPSLAELSGCSVGDAANKALSWAAKITHVAAVVCAIVALSIRALGDGFRSEAHIARLKGYRDEVLSLRSSFLHNRTPKAFPIISMEHAAHNEMVEFLRAGQASHFII